MTSISDNTKVKSNSNLRKKIGISCMVLFFAFVIIFGIKCAYAYYTMTTPMSIIASSVGDFDTGDGDINVMVYKKNQNNDYVTTYGVPASGYQLTNVSCDITCTTNSSDNCYYVYSDVTDTISVTSNKKVTCKFYFDPLGASDVNVYIMKEDSQGSHTYNSKKYTMVNVIPAYGYEYSSGTCDDGVSPTYDSSIRQFNVSLSEKTNCYAYFNAVGSSDIVVNTYVQSASGSSVYNKVDSIPANRTYKLSVSKTSSCKYKDGTTATAPTYSNGYIQIDASAGVTCEVYLDLD